MEVEKRNIWRDDEVTCMLSIYKEKNIMEQFNGKKYGYGDIYKTIEQEMKAKGFTSKNYVQISTKWKKLKSDYGKIKRQMATNQTSDTKDLQFFSVIDELMTSQAAAAAGAAANGRGNK